MPPLPSLAALRPYLRDALRDDLVAAVVVSVLLIPQSLAYAMLAGLPKAARLGLLIIDHDMPLIMRLCHRLHVLASGRTIAEGDVASVRRSPEVIAAYLGAAAVDA